MKKCIIILCVILILSVGCVSQNVSSFHPVQHPNSTWIAKNEGISFTVGEDATSPILGLLVVENNEIEIEIHMGIYVSMIEVRAIVDIDNSQVETIEIWQAKTVKKDVFTITVVESTYFEKDQQITFKREHK